MEKKYKTYLGVKDFAPDDASGSLLVDGGCVQCPLKISEA